VHPNKIIAFDLEISLRTVEIYRANVITNMKARSLRMTLAAGVIQTLALPADPDQDRGVNVSAKRARCVIQAPPQAGSLI
jgi:hypothetical protein